jgi:hypothetical protein
MAYFPSLVGNTYEVTKQADQSIASSTTLINDVDLASQTLVVGATYFLQLRYQLLGVGGTAQGYKVGVTFSGTFSGLANGGGILSSNGAPAAFSLGINGGANSQAAISTTGDVFNFDATFKVLTAGVINTVFAQTASSANATVAKANSTLLLTRVA